MADQPVGHFALFRQNRLDGRHRGDVACFLSRREQGGITGDFKLFENIAADRALYDLIGFVE